MTGSKSILIFKDSVKFFFQKILAIYTTSSEAVTINNFGFGYLID